MPNRGADVTATPTNLIEAVNLVSNQEYMGQVLGRSRVFIGEFASIPDSVEDRENAFALTADDNSFQIPSINGAAPVYVWCDDGNTNRIVVDES